MIVPGRGIKTKLDIFLIENNEESLELIKKITLNPQKLDEVVLELSAVFNLNITYCKLKRFIKEKFNYTWHRFKKWLKPKQDPVEYQRIYEVLQQLKTLEESDFCLNVTN
jgi:hypothetical protein